ncbi:sensor histidine kinase [Alicyclobacillus mengziensis]|uniref:histidine kinase n=1 Tax=Alicyclobacillus mengziensis TaxID=2931921 RepID=A0A9X7VZY4_9BACL|nr:sensor histidine kinase [Alicyclobacillus mengziensis]QSO48131.1 sensor histidine kinase [Alicyclobacillus mengziensis]
MDNRIQAMQNAIQHTLTAISEGRERVEEIAASTEDEVARLETEFAEVQTQVGETIQKVEELERDSRVARQRLVVVNKRVSSHSEKEMKEAYDTAYDLQIQLGQWQEREVQLRLRRDDIARRLKALRATAHQAEVLLVKFGEAATTLQSEFADAQTVLENARLQSVLGIRMLQMQEDERRQLAQRLHDGPLQHLASLSMRAQSAYSPNNESMDLESAVDLRGRLNDIIGSVRQIVFDLRPPLLDDLGLVPTLRRYVEQWSVKAGIEGKVTLMGLETRLSPTEKITLFRTVQEALHNALDHAEATKVSINLMYGVDKLTIQVIDNGKGVNDVNWSDWVESGRLGLMLCRQRLAVLGGELSIASAGTGGTCVEMTLPLKRAGTFA